jgi:RNA polymerase sigma factor (sigma-70 family)
MMRDAMPLRPEVLLEHAGWVRRLAGRLLADAAAADDAAQEALVVALGGGPGDASQARPWLAAVLRNVVRHMRRATGRRDARERAVARNEAVEATDEIVARASLQRAVVDAVLALAEPYRTTVLMRFFDELPTSEIAARRSEPVETVRTRLKRGLALLREKLSRELDVETSEGTRRRGLGALVMLVEPGRTGSLLVTSATAGATGAVVMGVGSKIVVATLAVAACAVAIWTAAPRPSRSDGRLTSVSESQGASTQARNPDVTPTRRALAQESESSAASTDDKAARSSGSDELPEMTTATMERMTAFDRDPAIKLTMEGLLKGNVEPGPLVQYALAVVQKARLIPSSPDFREGKPPGKRRWIEYRSDDGSICRAAIERFVATDGDSSHFTVALPVAPTWFASPPRELADARLTLAIDMHGKTSDLITGSVSLDLHPDEKKNVTGLKPYWALLDFQGDGRTGKSVHFSGTPGRGVSCVMVAYPVKINQDLHSAEYGAADEDWTTSHGCETSVLTDARSLVAGIDRQVDE